MLSRRQALLEALGNIAQGTQEAANLKNSATDPDVRRLANSLYYIGYGAQQAIYALTDRGRINDLDL